MHSLSLCLFLISGLKNDKYTSSKRTVLGRIDLRAKWPHTQSRYPNTWRLRVDPSKVETRFLLSCYRCLDNSRVTAFHVGFQPAFVGSMLELTLRTLHFYLSPWILWLLIWHPLPEIRLYTRLFNNLSGSRFHKTVTAVVMLLFFPVMAVNVWHMAYDYFLLILT